MRRTAQRSPAFVIALGGFPGTGKTTVARRLAAELGVPRLEADTLGRTIRASQALIKHTADAQWIAYDVLFRLADEFLQTNASVILDINLGWPFQWQQLDVLKQRHPTAPILPIMLRCSRDICLERIRGRYTANPADHDPPEVFTTQPSILRVWTFLEQLERPDMQFVDAANDHATMYAEVLQYVTQQLNNHNPC